jgi:hypothetical protein
MSLFECPSPKEGRERVKFDEIPWRCFKILIYIFVASFSGVIQYELRPGCFDRSVGELSAVLAMLSISRCSNFGVKSSI